MGPEDSEKKAVKLYMMVDGEPVEISHDIVEITFSEGRQGNGNPALDDCEFSVQMKLMQSMRCRSRKRFVKLLMASGIDRNAAQALARCCVVWRNQRGIPVCLKTSYQSYFIGLSLRGLVKLGKWRTEKN